MHWILLWVLTFHELKRRLPYLLWQCCTSQRPCKSIVLVITKINSLIRILSNNFKCWGFLSLNPKFNLKWWYSYEKQQLMRFRGIAKKPICFTQSPSRYSQPTFVHCTTIFHSAVYLFWLWFKTIDSTSRCLIRCAQFTKEIVGNLTKILSRYNLVYWQL